VLAGPFNFRDYISGLVPLEPLGARDSVVREDGECKQDNCLRVLTNTPVVASTFCSTYIASTTVTTITPTVTISGTATITPAPPSSIPDQVIPNHISLRCQAESRLSSACSCLSITPRTVTSTAVAPAETTTVSVSSPLDSASSSFSSPLCEDLESPYVVNSQSYDIHCGSVYKGTFMNSDAAGLGSMEECMLACSMVDGCVAVDWAQEELQCGLLSSLKEGMVTGYNSAVLVVES